MYRYIEIDKVAEKLSAHFGRFRGIGSPIWMTAYALAPTFIAEPTNNLPAWFGPLVPADFWAFDSMRRVPMAQTMPLGQSKH